MSDDAYEQMASQDQEAKLLEFLDERLSQLARDRRSYWQQWTQPQTVIAIVVAVATIYGSWVVQSERIDVMRSRIDVIERDYQRRDVLTERLNSIDDRLKVIEDAVRADEQRRLKNQVP